MIKKLCPRCHRASYSSSENSPWVCPTCTEDLTHSPTLPIDAKEPQIRKMKVIQAYIKNSAAL